MQLVHKSELLLVHFYLAARHRLLNVMKWSDLILRQNLLLPLEVWKSSLFLLIAWKHVIFLAPNLRSPHSSLLEHLVRVWFSRRVVSFLVRFLRSSIIWWLQLLWHEINLRMRTVELQLLILSQSSRLRYRRGRTTPTLLTQSTLIMGCRALIHRLQQMLTRSLILDTVSKILICYR